jgi:L-threonylcarbamoyladenylate synthase
MQEEIDKAVQILKDGGLILYPTDTIWGIGCDATNETAVRKVFELKRRADSKSMIILIGEPTKLNKYVRDVPAIAWDFVELTESPLTIIYPNAYNLAKNVVNPEDGTIAIRVCKHEFCQKVIRKLNKPIVSTSANVSGTSTATSFASISEEIKSGVNYIVNLEQNFKTPATPSKIIKLEMDGTIQIIRK